MGFNTGDVGEMWVLTRERLGQVLEDLRNFAALLATAKFLKKNLKSYLEERFAFSLYFPSDKWSFVASFQGIATIEQLLSI